MRLLLIPILIGSSWAVGLSPGAQAQLSQESSPRVDIELRDTYYLGETPQMTIAGMAPDESVTVHLFRMVDRWLSDGNGGWRKEPTLLQGWARYRTDAAGRIALSNATPEDGTSKAEGPATLFWSARRGTDPLLADQRFAQSGVSLRDDGTHLIRVTRGIEIIAERRFRINVERPDMTRVEINTPQLAGFFAVAAGAKRAPVIIHLHGSEGGSTAKARDIAQRYAQAGFATLAITYFSWPYEASGLSVPGEHRNIPIELLDRARIWLGKRPEADTQRIALVGNSKGGEFAMIGAATFPWVRAAVGCVPSDVSWQGYGATSWNGSAVTDLPAEGTYSSWSWRGAPLDYIPTYADRRDGFIDNTDRYDRARAEFSQAARAARIPIERTRAYLYLIGGDRDRTWASGAMTRSLVNAMDATGRGSQVESLISPTGGHFLCGDGLYPHRAWQEDSPSTFAPDIDAQGRAEFSAYEGKIAFLRRVLMQTRQR